MQAMRPTNKTLYLFLLGLGAFASTILAQTPGTFTPTGNMTTPRASPSVTLLLNGKVLIAGGAALAPELYDPVTGIFTATGNMIYGGSCMLLPDGRVLCIGAGAEFYGSFTGTFTTGRALALSGDKGQGKDRLPGFLHALERRR
jgi:hypothetical protein